MSTRDRLRLFGYVVVALIVINAPWFIADVSGHQNALDGPVAVLLAIIWGGLVGGLAIWFWLEGNDQ